MLRISDVIELAMVSRKTIYNAINSGRLKYQLVAVDNRQVRMFREEDVFDAFPRANRGMTREQEVQALREEVASLKFALSELQKAVDAMDPASQYEMTSISGQVKKAPDQK
ncbi:DNA-binding protein [Paramixta manurensis]|uniref:DNA-binding protein n=1 Tax=Paramixta manurensis TaxID=2740817 RepID=A0A6M8U6S3_9GAMM|nr:DNA-binding protein [Erwiniaceae bacterium PD-1]